MSIKINRFIDLQFYFLYFAVFYCTNKLYYVQNDQIISLTKFSPVGSFGPDRWSVLAVWTTLRKRMGSDNWKCRIIIRLDYPETVIFCCYVTSRTHFTIRVFFKCYMQASSWSNRLVDRDYGKYTFFYKRLFPIALRTVQMYY